MPKVVRFKTTTDNVVEFLEGLIEEVKNNNITNILVASKIEYPDRWEILTGYTHNLDFGTKQELVSHLQMDIIKQMIDENYLN